ncbi:magnesium transporter [Rhodococcus oryzae]|uniref:Magnesium transporter MgtE n=1 Tax=Rhodococcus oryzae TaxID=2571143 RepID=A0ABY2RQN9_9NOCA|nr:magnesium transporter [Rhodococcus oryzae]TJZ81381.1 magnesium transporter [Rhodococcus oryzae]
MNREEIIVSVRMLLQNPDPDAFRRLVRECPPADIAEVLRDAAPQQVSALLLTLPSREQARLFVELLDAEQDAVLAATPSGPAATLIGDLPPDERADLYNRLSSDGRERLIPLLAQAEREDVLRLAAYPEGTAGSVTTSAYATVSAGMTVGDSLQELRTSAPDKETINVVYVIDGDGRLRGTIPLRELVLNRADTKVEELMQTDPVLVRSNDPDDKATEYIRRYNMLAVPVVDGDERMIGIVTVDDAMDIDREQDATQLARYGGTSAVGGPDLDLKDSSFLRIYGTRVFWLGLLTVFGLITSNFVAAQEDILAEVIILAAFLAPIIDMGGNTGSQSATLVLRSMALGQMQLRWRDIGFVIRRELGVALALGASIAVLEVVLTYFTKGDIGGEVLAIVGLSMLTCTVVGGVLGSLLPFLARKIGTDPATLSAPLITSIMDLVGVFIYFGFAYWFLADLIA